MAYDLAIATACYFGKYVHVETEALVNYRIGLFRELVRTLALTQWDGVCPVWCLWDDNSPIPQFPSRTDIDIDIVCHVNTNGPTKSASANVIDCLNFAQTLAPFTVVIDSDAVVHPDWVKTAFELVARYPQAPLWGLYNTKYHPVIDYNGFESDDDSTVFKHTNTIFGSLYRSSERGQRPLDEWCEKFICDLRDKTRVIPVLKCSVIQHTGMHGLNNVEGTVEDYDSSFEVL